jgi:hypothetical protein
VQVQQFLGAIPNSGEFLSCPGIDEGLMDRRLFGLDFLLWAGSGAGSLFEDGLYGIGNTDDKKASYEPDQGYRNRDGPWRLSENKQHDELSSLKYGKGQNAHAPKNRPAQNKRFHDVFHPVISFTMYNYFSFSSSCIRTSSEGLLLMS